VFHMNEFWKNLPELARDLRRSEAPPRVEARLVSAFRERNVGTVARPRAFWVLATTWASAAAALLALAVFLSHPHPAKPVHRTSPNAVQYTAVQTGVDGETAIPNDFESDFIPLPNAEEIAPNEEVNVVRVEVPRSTMIALGFPLMADTASESVEADVMLGADGLARAVRFLDE
jgi:hypothetical protein